MLKRPSQQRLTLEERIAVVVAIAIAIAIHLAIFLGGSGIGLVVREEKKRERLMVIRQVRELTPAPEIAVRVPDPRRVQIPAGGAEGAPGGSPPKPQPPAAPHGTLPPPPKAEITPKMEEDLQAAAPKEEAVKPADKGAAELGASSVSVVTDLPAATFTLSGPAEYRGTGTFWIRRGAPAGTYRITFSAVEGYAMPPPQTKELPEKGQVVFVGKYRRSTEVVVEADNPDARFTIYRPDGRPLDMANPGRAMYDDLPPGTYTAVFKDVPGHITPAPLSRTLVAGGSLVFSGTYRDAPGGGGGSGSGAGAGGSGGGSGSGVGSGSGSGQSGSGGGSGPGSGRGSARGSGDGGLDRRVQMIVKSYPPSRIEEEYEAIPYPGVIIRKSNFQQGWCQVYLVLQIDRQGGVESVAVERPQPADRARYELLIKAVEGAVRAWDYDKVRAEVHVDVRFYVE
jgi:hypothetical protein